MRDANVHLALITALAGVLLVLFGARQLLMSKGGRRALLVVGGLLPLVASAGTVKEGVEESSRARFCLSCHEMQVYGKSLFADNRLALPAVHFQNRLIDRDNACYTCHTDYALFGDIKAKLNGLRHVYVHYLGTIPEKPQLYQPYSNRNCLHCHDDGRRYIEAPAHQAVKAPLASGELSCLKCHAVGHDLKAVQEQRFWQAQ
jgi:cytochrome c-type protein NapC